MENNISLRTITAVLFGREQKLYRIKITQTFVLNTVSECFYLIEDEMGNIIDVGKKKLPINYKIDNFDCTKILSEFEDNKYGPIKLTKRRIK